MKIKLIFFVLTASLLTSCANYRTLGSKIDDNLLVPTIVKEFEAVNPALTNDDINRVVVSSYNGVVLLTGQVASNDLKDQAAKVVLSIVGVRALHNYIDVGPKVSKSVKVNDALITTKVKGRFFADSRLRANGIKVITENSVVYLMGKLTREDSNLALKTARMIEGDISQVVILFEII